VRRRHLAASAAVLVAAIALAACSSGSAKTPTATATLTPQQAETKLKAIVLQAADIGPDFTQDVGRAISNQVAARARPDTDQAMRQYAEWGQVLAYNVQYSTRPSAGLVFNAQTARVTNTATLFNSPAGATAALAYTRDLPPQTIADFLVNEGAGTKITDTQVVKELDVPAKGDESFAWRVSGKATFTNGFAVTFISDIVFVRVGRIAANVQTLALGAAPQRDQLLKLVDTFVARARAAQ